MSRERKSLGWMGWDALLLPESQKALRNMRFLSADRSKEPTHHWPRCDNCSINNNMITIFLLLLSQFLEEVASVKAHEFRITVHIEKEHEKVVETHKAVTSTGYV